MNARALAALFLTAIACGGTTTPGEGDAGTPCDQYAQAWCAKRSACTNGTLITRDYGDMPTCIARQTLSCNDRIAPSNTGQSPAIIQQCANGLSSFSCTDFLDDNLPAPCSPTGPVANGGACAFNAQCTSGYCANNRFANCGTCASPPNAGDSCATSGCGHDQSCIWNETVTNTCEPFVASGGACGAFSNPRCAADLTCQGSSTTTMTNGTCAAAVGSAGAACGGKSGGLGCDNTMGLTCFNGACLAIAYVGDGEPCGFTGSGITECKSGVCYSSGGPYFTSTGATSTGTCKAYAKDGAACDSQTGPECSSPARCIVNDGGSAGTCTPTSPEVSAACK